MSIPHLSLLVVDDEPSLRLLLSIAFRPTRFRTDTCESAEAALERLQTRRYDLMVVDKNLPGESGIELVRRVRALDPDVAIVAMSAAASAADVAELFALGVSRFVDKPFASLGALVRLVSSVAEEREARRGAAARAASGARAG